MAKGNARNIYLNSEQALLLDAIGIAMGKRRIGVEPSRSQLIFFTAVRNFIVDCGEEEDLREAIKIGTRAFPNWKGSGLGTSRSVACVENFQHETHS